MTTYVFDGSTNLEIANFRPALDTVIINGVDIDDVASFTESNETVTLTLTSGVVLTLGGVIFSSLTADNFEPAGGSDLVFGFGAAATGNIVIGTVGADTLGATTDGAFIYGLEGIDNIDTGGFVDATIYAGQGADNVTVDGGLVYGNDGADNIDLTVLVDDTATVFGGSDVVGTDDGADIIDGSASAGNLLIYGNKGADQITGGTGDDTIFGGQDGDIIDGGAGDNMLFGNQGDDSITGGAGDSTIFGGQDDDTIVGGAGDEAIYGNLGNDTLVVSGGVDTIVGGAGDDYVGDFALGATVAGGDLTAGSVVYGGLGNDTINVEVVAGVAGAQTSIFGGNNIVGAADGDDLITVTGTEDVSIFGNEGNDTIVGGAGSNSIFGGMGNDSIQGRSAAGEVTTLTGGQGNDIFVANAYTAGAGATDAGYSIVADFTKGSDTIEFTAAPTSFSTVTVGAATSFDTVDDVVTAYNAQLDVANEAIAIVIQSGDLAGHTVLLNSTTGAGADEVIVLTGAQNQLALSDFS